MSAFSPSPHGRSAKVREDAIRDPFLCSIDNVNIAPPLGSSSDCSNIGASCNNRQSINRYHEHLHENRISHHQAQSLLGKIESSPSAYPEGNATFALRSRS
jgi:hypothetical protein